MVSCLIVKSFSHFELIFVHGVRVCSSFIDLHFSNNQRYSAFFHVLVGHLYIFFGEMFIQVFYPFFHWVVGFFAVELYKLFIYFRD